MQIAAKRPVTFCILSQSYKLYRFNQQLNIFCSEWVIIALLILLLFGGKKIPELMKGLGKGVKSFKDGVNEAKEEINKAKDDIEEPASKK